MSDYSIRRNIKSGYENVDFFLHVRAQLAKFTIEESQYAEDVEIAISQLISNSIITDGVVDIFDAAGLETPNISILSDKFLEEVRSLPHRNVALETLRKLLNDQIRVHSKSMLVQARSFAEMLENTIKRYLNRSIDTAEAMKVNESLNS